MSGLDLRHTVAGAGFRRVENRRQRDKTLDPELKGSEMRFHEERILGLSPCPMPRRDTQYGSVSSNATLLTSFIGIRFVISSLFISSCFGCAPVPGSTISSIQTFSFFPLGIEDTKLLTHCLHR